jgi:hypothetical protein
MKLLDNFGVFFLSVWLIVWSALSVFVIPVHNIQTYFAVLSIVAGSLLFFRLNDPKAYVNVGMLLLAIWLILWGVLPLLNIDFPGNEFLLTFLAVASALFFLPAIVLGTRTFYNVGLFFLAIWLLASQLIPVLGYHIQAFNVPLALLAIMTAFLLLLGM